jgi:hypothetical protein
MHFCIAAFFCPYSINPMPTRSIKPTSRIVFLRIIFGALVATLGGCVSKEYSYSTTVSGGERIRFTFANGRPAPAKAEGIQIIDAGLLPNPAEKKVFYGFHLIADSDLKSVRVEDVSEEQPVLLYEDLSPKLEQRRWKGTTKAFSADDPEIKWVFYIAETVRVFRFTVTMADGRTVVLHQAAMVPAWMKGVIRSMFGEKY